MTNADPFDLQRFVDAQRDLFDSALAELRAGAKHSHWMWFVFPQIAGLGRSPTSRFYAIRSAEEAAAYLAHPLLGPRLRLAVDTVLPLAPHRTAEAIFGPVDAAKLRSSLTLFEAASGDPLFGQALDLFYDGRRDQASLDLLGL